MILEQCKVVHCVDLSNAYLLANFGFDTAESEPSKVWRRRRRRRARWRECGRLPRCLHHERLAAWILTTEKKDAFCTEAPVEESKKKPAGHWDDDVEEQLIPELEDEGNEDITTKVLPGSLP